MIPTIYKTEIRYLRDRLMTQMRELDELRESIERKQLRIEYLIKRGDPEW